MTLELPELLIADPIAPEHSLTEEEEQLEAERRRHDALLSGLLRERETRQRVAGGFPVYEI